MTFKFFWEISTRVWVFSLLLVKCGQMFMAGMALDSVMQQENGC